MIRQARIEDIDRMLEITKEFREEGLEKYSPLIYDDVTLRETAMFLVNFGIALVAEVKGKIAGYICGTLERSVMDKNQLIGAERIWCVAKEYRQGRLGLKLLSEFERICKFKGANIILVGIIVSINHKSMQKLYERLGFTFIEEHFAKRIS